MAHVALGRIVVPQTEISRVGTAKGLAVEDSNMGHQGREDDSGQSRLGEFALDPVATPEESSRTGAIPRDFVRALKLQSHCRFAKRSRFQEVY